MYFRKDAKYAKESIICFVTPIDDAARSMLEGLLAKIEQAGLERALHAASGFVLHSQTHGGQRPHYESRFAWRLCVLARAKMFSGIR